MRLIQYIREEAGSDLREFIWQAKQEDCKRQAAVTIAAAVPHCIGVALMQVSRVMLEG